MKHFITAVALCYMSFGAFYAEAHTEHYEESYWQAFKERSLQMKDQTIQFWLPKVKDTSVSVRDYWSPRIAPVMDRTVEYWSPIIGPILDRTFEYWDPRLQEAKENSIMVFLDHVHPVLINGYNWYYQNAGSHVSSAFWASYDYMQPYSQKSLQRFTSTFQENDPITFNYLSDIPATLKIPYEKFIIFVWQQLYDYSDEELLAVAGDKIVSAKMAIAAGNALRNTNPSKEAAHLNQLLDQLRPYARDKGMEDCYNVVYLDFEILNAFNIGCNIFFSGEMYEMFKDNERMLRAVLAHEMAHGDRGHGIKTAMNLISALGNHFGELAFKEAAWVFTGETFDYIDEVSKRGNIDMAMEKVSQGAPAIEVDADRHATRILLSAGFSEYDLIDALKILHDETGMSACDGYIESAGKRSYPNYCEREAAILEEAKIIRTKRGW